MNLPGLSAAQSAMMRRLVLGDENAPSGHTRGREAGGWKRTAVSLKCKGLVQLAFDDGPPESVRASLTAAGRLYMQGPASLAESDLDIEELPERIEELRTKFLFEHGDDLDPEAEQLYLLAIGALEQAERFAKLAVYKTRQARSGDR